MSLKRHGPCDPQKCNTYRKTCKKLIFSFKQHRDCTHTPNLPRTGLNLNLWQFFFLAHWTYPWHIVHHSAFVPSPVIIDKRDAVFKCVVPIQNTRAATLLRKARDGCACLKSKSVCFSRSLSLSRQRSRRMPNSSSSSLPSPLLSINLNWRGVTP